MSLDIEKEVDENVIDGVMRSVFMDVYRRSVTSMDSYIWSRVETQVRHNLWLYTMACTGKMEEKFIEAYEY